MKKISTSARLAAVLLAVPLALAAQSCSSGHDGGDGVSPSTTAQEQLLNGSMTSKEERGGEFFLKVLSNQDGSHVDVRVPKDVFDVCQPNYIVIMDHDKTIHCYQRG